MRPETLAAGLFVVLMSSTAAAQHTTGQPGQFVGDNAGKPSSCQTSDEADQGFGDIAETVFTGRGSSLVYCVGGVTANVHHLGYVLANVRVRVDFRTAVRNQDLKATLLSINNGQGIPSGTDDAVVDVNSNDDCGGANDPRITSTTDFAREVILVVNTFDPEDGVCYDYKVVRTPINPF